MARLPETTTAEPVTVSTQAGEACALALTVLAAHASPFRDIWAPRLFTKGMLHNLNRLARALLTNPLAIAREMGKDVQESSLSFRFVELRKRLVSQK